MIAILALAAALGALPKAVEADVRERDYPAAALRRQAVGYTRAEAVVAVDGRVLRCDLISSSRSRELDTRACALIMHRFQFSVGRDEEGAPIAGIARVNVNWGIIGSRYTYAPSTDMTLPVSGLPSGISGEAKTTVRVVLDATDRVESCVVDESSGSAQLDRLVCQALPSVPLTLARDAGGTPLRAVRPFTVSFKAER